MFSSSPAPKHSSAQHCDEVGVAGGDGGALYGDMQLQRYEGRHCPGLANQLQVVDFDLDLKS